MEVQALSLLAGPVVVDHAGAVERRQHLPGENLVDLAVRDVRDVYKRQVRLLSPPLTGAGFPLIRSAD